ncbi:MAG: hypothetical protein KatS3mg131_1148 [Candidatus Tectimicrobiota bacterium]|nr:MAG: hypothetical protein KatS3mg131_1148 [Candidatus Tectomicrobia bacterium]
MGTGYFFSTASKKVACPLFLVLLVQGLALAAGDPQAGKALYQRLCVSCHGADGRGGRLAAALPSPPPNLADAAYLAARTDAQLLAALREGRGAMPAFGDRLSEAQLQDLVAYVRTLAAAAPAAPAAALSLTRLRLSIWPEYDDPRVLVMLRGEVAPATALPTRLALPLPRGAELIGAGMISPAGELLLQPHEVRRGEKTDTLVLSLPAPRFFVEWYYEPFAAGQAEKQFAYTLALSYPIAHLEVDIQQPLAARDFATEPPAMVRSRDERGFTYHRFLYQDVQAPLTFRVRYVKTDPTPSVPRSAPSLAAPLPATPYTDYTLLAFATLGLAAVLLAGGAWLWRRAPRQRPAAAAPPPPPARPNFCAQCGRRLLPAYRFCPGCGRPLDTP